MENPKQKNTRYNGNAFWNNPPTDVPPDTHAKTSPDVQTQAFQPVESPSLVEHPVITSPKKSSVPSIKIIIVIASATVVIVGLVVTVILLLTAQSSEPETATPSTVPVATRADAFAASANEGTASPATTTTPYVTEPAPTTMPTPNTTTGPVTSLAEKSSFSISPKEIESEIAKIRVYYYTPTSEDTQKIIEKGTGNWSYSRDYRYHNGQLVFAFVFDGTEEHRLYFYDNHMIRYIDENHITYDYPDSKKFDNWEERVLSEAY